jgi:hypothetical protein
MMMMIHKMMIHKMILILSLSFLMTSCNAPEKINEKWYQQRWCKQIDGQIEVRLEDKTRCDCLTDKYAIEVDFSRKWAEAVGQSLHYAKMTGKQAGILLIVESEQGKKHLTRLESVIAFHDLPINVWTTSKSELD